MHSSVGVGRSQQEPPIAPVVSLRVIETGERRSAAANFRRVVVACEAAADLLTIVLAVLLSYVLYSSFSLGRHIHYPTHAVLGLAFAFAIIMVLMLDRVGAYRRGNSLLRVRETEQVLRVSAQAFLIALAVSFFSSVLVSRWLLVMCLTFVPLSLFIQKTFVYLVVRSLHSRGFGIEKVLIYGAGAPAGAFFRSWRDLPSSDWSRSLLLTTIPARSAPPYLKWDMNGDVRRAS